MTVPSKSVVRNIKNLNTFSDHEGTISEPPYQVELNIVASSFLWKLLLKEEN